MSKEIELKSECLLSNAELLVVLERESAKLDSGFYNTLDAMEWAQQALLAKAAGKHKEMTAHKQILSDNELMEIGAFTATGNWIGFGRKVERAILNRIEVEKKQALKEHKNAELLRLAADGHEFEVKTIDNSWEFRPVDTLVAAILYSGGDDIAWRVKAQPDAASNVAPVGWQLIPIEPTEQQIVAAMEASLLGRPSPDDESYVMSIINAYLEAGKQSE